MASSRFRTRSAVIAALSTGTTAIAAACLAAAIGTPAAAGVGLIGAVVAGAAAWFAFSPITRVLNIAEEVAGGNREPTDWPAVGGELEAVPAALRAVEASRRTLEQSSEADLIAIADAIALLADPRSTATPPLLITGEAATQETFKANFEAATREVTSTRNRLAWVGRVLSGFPDAIVVADGTSAVRYKNSAAEKVFGPIPQRGTLGDLFAVAESPVSFGEDPPVPIADPNAVMEWLKGGASGTILAQSAVGRVVEVTAAIPAKVTRDSIITLVGRDGTAARGQLGTDRATVRANVVKAFLDCYLSETGESLAQLTSQHRLLTSDAKQSGSRDALTAKLALAGQSLRQLETFHTLAAMVRAAVWNELPAETPSEFMPGEVGTALVARLAARLKARGNTLKVVDQGGWMFADSDRLEAALTGVLVHAGATAANTQLELRITRLPLSADRPEPTTEFLVPDAGPIPAADQLAVVNRPFGGLGATPLTRFSDVGGFPLGLIAAARLASAMGGELRFENDAGGFLGLRMLIPTRRGIDAPAVTVASIAPGALDVAPLEEVVTGWRLGVPAPQVPA